MTATEPKTKNTWTMWLHKPSLGFALPESQQPPCLFHRAMLKLFFGIKWELDSTKQLEQNTPAPPTISFVATASSEANGKHTITTKLN